MNSGFLKTPISTKCCRKTSYLKKFTIWPKLLYIKKDVQNYFTYPDDH